MSIEGEVREVLERLLKDYLDDEKVIDFTLDYSLIDTTLSSILSLTTDNKFISHIQSHLKPNEEVICKICGKTAKEIINEKL